SPSTRSSDRLHDLLAAAIPDPFSQHVGRGAEGQGADKVGDGNGATPVAHPVVAAGDGATAHGVQDFQGGQELAGAVNVDLDVSVGHFVGVLGELLEAIAQEQHVFGKGAGNINIDGACRGAGK